MKAILLAAGLGTRLRPITDSIPKCLVPIKGKPLLQIWLESLTKAGVGPFLINTHYLSDQVEAFANKSPFRDQLTLKYEQELLGTAGTLLANIDFFNGEDGMLIHADNYCLANFKQFILAHNMRPIHCNMTMMVFKTDNPSSCGIVELDKNSIVTSFYEKVNNAPGDLANGAIYILSKELLNELSNSLVNDFSAEVIPQQLNKIFAYQINTTLVDIGSIQNYLKYRD